MNEDVRARERWRMKHREKLTFEPSFIENEIQEEGKHEIDRKKKNRSNLRRRYDEKIRKWIQTYQF